MPDSAPGPEVSALADQLGLRHLENLPFGKFLYADESRALIAKVSASPTGLAMIRNEALGLERIAPLLGPGIKPPKLHRFIDEDGTAALVMEQLEGSPATKWQSQGFSLTPALMKAPSQMLLSELLDHHRTDEKLRAGLLDRFGDTTVTVTPSHGDLVYWNVLRMTSGVGLIDFEYFDEARVAGFDDLHYLLAPQLFRLSRWRLPDSVILAAGHIACRRCMAKQRLELDRSLMLAMFFVQWASIRRRFGLTGRNELTAQVERLALKC